VNQSIYAVMIAISADRGPLRMVISRERLIPRR